MNDFISFFEIAILTYCFITTWAMHEDYLRLRKEHDKMMDLLEYLQHEFDHLYKKLTRLEEEQNNE